MKIVEINLGTPQAPIMTRRFLLYPGYSTSGVANPKIVLNPGVGLGEINTDANYRLSVDPSGRTIVDIEGTFLGGPQQPGGVFFKRYGDGDPIVEFELQGDLSGTYDGVVKGTALPGVALRIGDLLFGNTTVKVS